MREKSNTTVLHVSSIHGPRTAEVRGVLTLLILWLKITIGYLSLTVLSTDYTLSGSFALGSDVSWHCGHMKDLPGCISRYPIHMAGMWHWLAAQSSARDVDCIIHTQVPLASYSMAAGFQVGASLLWVSKKLRQEWHGSCDPASNTTWCHICCILLVKSKSRGILPNSTRPVLLPQTKKLQENPRSNLLQI